MDEEKPLTTLEEFWETVGEKPFGCTERQVAYVKAVMDGVAPAWAACRAAGYAGTKKSLAVQGTTLKRHQGVQRLLKAAQEAQELEENYIVTPDELIKMWSNEAKFGQTPSSRQKAQEFLARYYALFQEQATKQETTGAEGNFRRIR
ncbi:MAG: hypothetical protein OEZ68_02380 [Gammaproteobacteria bacterium]|nr:hypothetical protein [Gammaproteobacteria bacterium]MDH5799629.1 hypothetical protein [Gammaproteobacteria bacterium]